MKTRFLRHALMLALPLLSSISFAASDITLAPAVSNAAQSDPASLVALAVRHEHGEGVARDYLRAASLYCTAARAGNADAIFALGWMYANGRGMPVDDRFAARLFRLAADGGHVHASALIKRMPDVPDAGLPPCLIPEVVPVERTDVVQAGETSSAGPDLRNISGAKIHQLITKLAPRYQIDPNLAMAIVYIESGFNVNARSPKNAQGLMQLMPDTARRFNVKNTYDAEENIKGGLAYLRWLLAHFAGDVALVAAAYNAGEGAVARYKGVPPFAETKAYVAKLAKLYQRTAHPYGGAKPSTPAFLKVAATTAPAAP